MKENIEPVQSLKISAYPNPVVNKTKIRISVANDTEASILIYDMEGRIVKSIHNGFLKMGELEFVWDGKNENNEPLASGSYLCVITADGKSDFVNLKLNH